MGIALLVGALAIVLITGLVKIRRSTNALVNEHNFVHEFRDKFVEFTNVYLYNQQQSDTFGQLKEIDWQAYHWLVANMDKTQGLLGSYGTAHYTAPFNRFQVANYAYIINTIPQIRMGRADQMDLLTCDDMMVRYMGAMQRMITDEERRSKKPFIWLQLGVQFYIGLPIRILYWFGIISSSSLSRITSSQLFKILSGIGGLAGFLAALMQILQGWPSVRDLF